MFFLEFLESILSSFYFILVATLVSFLLKSGILISLISKTVNRDKISRPLFFLFAILKTLPRIKMTNETQTEFWLMKLVNDTLAIRTDIKKGLENDSLIQIISPIIDLNDRFIIDRAFGLPDTANILIQK